MSQFSNFIYPEANTFALSIILKFKSHENKQIDSLGGNPGRKF